MYLNDENTIKIRRRLEAHCYTKGLPKCRAEEITDKFLVEYLPEFLDRNPDLTEKFTPPARLFGGEMVQPDDEFKATKRFDAVLISLFYQAALSPFFEAVRTERGEFGKRPKPPVDAEGCPVQIISFKKPIPPIEEIPDGDFTMAPIAELGGKVSRIIPERKRIPDHTLFRAALEEATENNFALAGLSWAARNEKVHALLLVQLFYAVAKGTLGPFEANEIFLIAAAQQEIIIPARSRQRSTERQAREVDQPAPVEPGSAWAEAMSLAREAGKKLAGER